MIKKQPIRKFILTTIKTIQSQIIYYILAKQQGFVSFKHTDANPGLIGTFTQNSLIAHKNHAVLLVQELISQK